MTDYVGREAVLKTDATGGTPAAIAGIQSWSVRRRAAPVENTGQNDEWESSLGGSKARKSWTCEVTYKYDPAGSGQSNFTPGAEIDAEFFPSGDTSTHKKLAGTFIVEEMGLPAPADNGLMVQTITGKGSGALTESTIA